MEDIYSIKSFDWSSALYTAFFFLIGLIYYIYKFYNFRNLINNGVYRRNTENNNNDNNNNQSGENNSNQSNTNNNSNNIPDSEQENYLRINFLIAGNRDRETHTIHKDLPLRTFIQMHLSRYFNTDYQSVYLIYQGIRLDISKSLSFYPQIKNDVIIHFFITSLHSNSENSRNRERERNMNFTSNLEFDDNTVQLQSIVLHSCFFMIGFLLLFVYKKHPELFSRSSRYIFGFIYIIWLNQLSKVLAKYIIFRRINWNI
jgi:hypothetical protein